MAWGLKQHVNARRVAYRRQFTAHCTRNLSEFPSDLQSCSLLFVLRNHPSADIRVANTSAPYNASDPRHAALWSPLV